MFVYLFTFVTIILSSTTLKDDFLSPQKIYKFRSNLIYKLLTPVVVPVMNTPFIHSDFLTPTALNKAHTFYSKNIPRLKFKKLNRISHSIFENPEDLMHNYYVELQKNIHTRRTKMLRKANFAFVNLSLKSAKTNQIILSFLLKKYTNKTKNYFKKLSYRKLFWKYQIFSFLINKKLKFLTNQISPQKIQSVFIQRFRSNRLAQSIIWEFFRTFFKKTIKQTHTLLTSLFKRKAKRERKRKVPRPFEFSFLYFPNSLILSVYEKAFIKGLKCHFLRLGLNDFSSSNKPALSKTNKIKSKKKPLLFNSNFGQISNKSCVFLWNKLLANFNLILSTKILGFFSRKTKNYSISFDPAILSDNVRKAPWRHAKQAPSSSVIPGFDLKKPEQSHFKFLKIVRTNMYLQEKRLKFLIRHFINTLYIRGQKLYSNNKSSNQFQLLQQRKWRRRRNRKIFFMKLAANKSKFSNRIAKNAQKKFYKNQTPLFSRLDKVDSRRYYSKKKKSKRRASSRPPRYLHLRVDKNTMKDFMLTTSSYKKDDTFDLFSSSTSKYIRFNFYKGPYDTNIKKNQKPSHFLLSARSISDFIKRCNNRSFFLNKRRIWKHRKSLLHSYLSGKKSPPLSFRFPSKFNNRWKRDRVFVFSKKKFISMFNNYCYKLKFLGRHNNKAYYKKVFAFRIFKTKKNYFKRIFLTNYIINYKRMLRKFRKKNKKPPFKIRRKSGISHKSLLSFRLRFFYKDFFKKLNITKFKDIFTYLRYGYFFIRHQKELSRIRRGFKWFLKKRFERRNLWSKFKKKTLKSFGYKIRKKRRALLSRYNYLGLKHKHIPRKFTDAASFFPYFSSLKKLTIFFKQRNILRSSLKVSDFLNKKLSTELTVLNSFDFFRPKYYLFFKKKKNNFYITVTDRKGGVVFFQSCGYYLSKSLQKRNKKIRSAFFNLKFMIPSIALSLRKKKIRRIHTFFQNRHLPSWWLKRLCRSFTKAGVFVSHIRFVPSISHGSKNKKKKARRL